MYAWDAVAALRFQPVCVEALELAAAPVDRLPRVLEPARVDAVRPGLVGGHATPAHDVGSPVGRSLQIQRYDSQTGFQARNFCHSSVDPKMEIFWQHLQILIKLITTWIVSEKVSVSGDKSFVTSSYSDSAGKLKKCNCKRLSLYPMISSKRRSFLGPKTVTIAGSAL